MKKLVFLINTLNCGGAERVLVELANRLVQYDYDVTIQTISDRGVFKNNILPKVHYKSIIKTKNYILMRILLYVVCFLIPPSIIHRLFIGKKYDYEIAFLEGVPTKILSASCNKKSIKYAWVHIDLYNTFGLEKVYKNIDSHIYSYKKFDKIICVSESVKEAFTKKFGITQNIVVKYNLIDDKLIKEKSLEYVGKSSRFRIVSVGRLEYQKGYDRLIAILKQLLDEHFDCELILVGDGRKRRSLECFVNSNDLDDRVTFVGFCENPYKYMKSADLLVFPSRAEGCSTVANEAIILGKPTVVTNCSGMTEIFGQSEYGLITENTYEGLYNGIKTLMCNDNLLNYYANKAQERSKNFSVTSRFEQIKQLFE